MLKLRPIIKDPDERLRKKSVDVTFPLSAKDEEIIQYLYDYLIFSNVKENQEKYNITAGVGLAAPQIGINKNMFALYITREDEEGKIVSTTAYAFINPRIIAETARRAYLLGGEGCLSIEAQYQGYVPRSAIVQIEGYDYLTKQQVAIKLRGYEAIVFQHEFDHLNGVLFYDRINKTEPFKKIDDAQEI
jgi:peptide deformylase